MKSKAGPCTVTSETERVSKDGVSLLSKLSLKYAGPNGFSLDKFQMKVRGSVEERGEGDRIGVASSTSFTCDARRELWRAMLSGY